MMIRLSNILQPVYEEILNDVKQDAIIWADETGWKMNGDLWWLWIFANKRSAFYWPDKSRGGAVVERILGPVFFGLLIIDGWGAYNKICALAKQRCFYHLFTALDKTDKHNQSKDWKAFRKKFSRLLRDAIRLSERRDQINVDVYQRRLLRLYARLDKLIVTDSEDKDVKRIIKRL